MNKWISVKDKLPEIIVNVLCYNEYSQMTIGHLSFSKDMFLDDHVHEIEKVTHWMPLPEAPNDFEIEMDKLLAEDYENMFKRPWWLPKSIKESN
jgi:hypothetical protein